MSRLSPYSFLDRFLSKNDLPTYPDFKALYIHLVTQIVPGPLSASYFIAPLLLVTALLIHPDTLSQRRLFAYFYVPSVAGTLHAWWIMGGVDVISVDCLLWAGFLIGWGGDARRWRRVWVCERECKSKDDCASLQSQDEVIKKTQSNHGEDDRQPSHYHEQPYPTPFLPRINFVLNALASTRLHRWLTSSPSHNRRQRVLPLHPPPTRLDFSLSLLPIILPNLLVLLPLTSQLARWDPNVHSVNPSPGQARPYLVSLIQQIIPARVLSPLTLGTHTYALLTLGFNLEAPSICLSNYLIGIPTDTWSPHTLPSYFGGFVEVLDGGVAGLWGKWWHAHMKVMCSAPGEAAARWLGWGEGVDGRSRGAWGKYALMVISAFFFSGVTHMGLVPPLAPLANVLRLRIAVFFWVQAFAVLFETGVVAAWKWLLRSRMGGGKSEESTSAERDNKTTMNHEAKTDEQVVKQMTIWKTTRRVCVLIWVLCWLSATLPLLEGPFDQLGWWKIWPPPLPHDGLRRVLAGEWIF